MARERMVTRTITSTEVSIMLVNLETAEVENKTLELGGTFKDEKAIEKAIEKRGVLPSTQKCVQIISSKQNEKIYGMSEQEFMEYAYILDENRHIPESTQTPSESAHTL